MSPITQQQAPAGTLESNVHEALASGWERLDDASGWAMGHSAWLRAWIEAAGDARIVTVGSADSPKGIVPLVPAGRRGGRLVAVTGEEPADVCLADEDAAAPLARALARLGRPFMLPRLPAESPIIPAMRAAMRGRGTVLVRTAPGTPTVPLEDVDPAEPEAVLGTRRRSDLRRARRRAERHGAVEAEFHAPSPGEEAALLDEAERVEASSWKGRSGTALALAAGERAAIRRFARLAAEAGVLRLALLRIGAVPGAMQIAIEKCGHYGLVKIGYDDRFARCSPGQLLMLESMRYAAERGLDTVEMLGGIEPWTAAWTRRHRRCVAVRVYPATPSGAAALAADAGTKAIRVARRRRRRQEP